MRATGILLGTLLILLTAGPAPAKDADAPQADQVVARGSRDGLEWSLGKAIGATLVGVPEGMSIDVSSGEISWTPTTLS